MKFNLNMEDIKYLKILYSDENNHPSSIKVAMKKVDEYRLTACIKAEDEMKIRTPQEITLSIICGEGLYRTQTRLISTSYEQPYLYLFMDTPIGLEYQQNREYFRVSAAFNASYYVNVNDEFKNYTTQTFDISANGVSIILPEHAVSEDDAEIDMMVNEKIVHAKIRYIRSEKTDGGYKISFTYSDISNRDRDYISQICIKKQLEDKRNKTA